MNTEKGRPNLPTATPAVASEGQDRDEAEGQPPQPACGQRGHPSQHRHGHEHCHTAPDHLPPSHPQLQHQGQREYQSAPAAPPVPVQPSARQRVDLFASQLSSGARALPVDAARCIATVAERVASHKGFMATLTQITRDEIGQQRSAARAAQVPATQELAAPINHPHQSPHQQQARQQFDDDDDEAVDVQAPQRNTGPRNGPSGFPQLNPGVLESDVSRPGPGVGVGSGNLGGLGGFGARRGAPSSWSSQAAASPVTRGSHDSLDSFAVLGGAATPHATTPPQAKAALNDDPDPASPGLQNDGGARDMATGHDSMHVMTTVVREPPVAREVTFMTPGSTPPIAVPCPTSEGHHAMASFENTPLKVAPQHHPRHHASAHKGAGTPMSAGASAVGSEWDVVETCDSAVAFEHAQWWSASSTDVGDASHVHSTSDHPAATSGATTNFFAGFTSASHAQQRDHHGHHHRHHHHDRSPHASKLGGDGRHSSPAPSGCPLPLHPGGVSGNGACAMSATGASLQSDQQIRTAAECEVFSTLSERPESSSEGVQSCAGRHDALSPTMTALTNDNQNDEEIDATRTLHQNHPTHHTPEEIDRSDVASPTSSSFNVSNVVIIPDQGADADAVPMPRPVAQTKTRPPMPVGLRRSIAGNVIGAAQEGVVETEPSTGVLSSQQWDTASSDVFLTREETTVFETNATVEPSLSDTLPPPSSSTSTAVGGGSFATAAVGAAAAAAAVGAAVGVVGMAAGATATATAPLASSDGGQQGTRTTATPPSTYPGKTRPTTAATTTGFVDPSNLPPPPPPPRDRVLAKAVHPSAHAHNSQSVNAADPDHALKHGGPISATPTRQPPQAVPATAPLLTATPPPSAPSDEPEVRHRSDDAAPSKNDFEPPASVVASLWGALLSIADELAGPGDDHADGVAAYGRRPDRSHDRHHAERHGEGNATGSPPAGEPMKTSTKTRASTKTTKAKIARPEKKSRHADAMWREGEFGGACDDVTLNSDHHFTASSTETQSMAGSRAASDIFTVTNANGDLVMGSAPPDAVNVNADECLNEGECRTDSGTDEDQQTDEEAEGEETTTTTNSDNTTSATTADRGASVPPSADRVFDSPSSLRHSAHHPTSVPESHHSTSLIHHEHNERRASPSTLLHADAPAGEFLEAPDERFIIASALLVNAAVAYYLTTGTGLGGIMEAVVETIQSAFEGASGRAVRRVAGEAGSRVLQISGI